MPLQVAFLEILLATTQIALNDFDTLTLLQLHKAPS
jgi:hypothetical protein